MKPRKNQYGSVKPYTRHETTCSHKDKPDYNNCRCAKWLYVNQRGTKPSRYSLKTPSWAEALGKANEVLDGFHPEIAEARSKQPAGVQKEAEEDTTIEEAVQLWLDRTEHMRGNNGTVRNYRSFFNTRLVRYVDKWNIGKPEAERITRIRQLTPAFCTKWYQSWNYKNTTMRMRWNVVRSFFSYLHQQGKITVNPVVNIKAVPRQRTFNNVPFTEEQYTDILNAVGGIGDSLAKSRDSKVYGRRLHIFIELLRWTGMDIGDAVQHRPAMVDANGVLRYVRAKTGVQAVIPFPAHMIELLKEVPLAPGSIPDMPFRYRGNDLNSDVHNWSQRIGRVLKAAGVTKVQLVEKSGVPAYDRHGRPVMKASNVKMLRHTFAVGCLIEGVPKENVARMLGHVGTQMIDEVYGPWVQGLEDAHILKVREIMDQAKPKKNLKLVSRQGIRIPAASR